MALELERTDDEPKDDSELKNSTFESDSLAI